MSDRNLLRSNTRLAARVRDTLILMAIVFSVAACKSGDSSTLALTPQPSPSVAVASTSAATPAGAAQNSYADVVGRVTPAVVTITSTVRTRAPQQFPFMDDPRFREFFGDRVPRGGGGGGDPQEPRGPRGTGLGSGVIVSQDGYILTNHHVVDGAEKIDVELTDKRTFTAKLVGSDPPSDLAVLKIDASNLPVLSLGDSDRVRVGDVALAIGNPLGVGQTVTAGIISAKSRQTGISDGSFEDFLQTDAPINRGNSGGALINTNGELIGINSQIYSPSGGNIGIGFAIPSNMARGVMDQLTKNGKVRRGFLGLGPQDVTADLAASFNLKEARGIIVRSVEPGGAAERAGLRQGDVITAFNGAPVTDSNSFRNRVASTTPGAEVTLTISRDGREQQVRATLNELTANAGRGGEQSGSGDGGTPGNNGGGGQLGISAEPLTPEIAGQLGLRSGTQGLVIANVDPSGPAADAGIQRGDVIEQVNRQPVRSVEDLRTALGRAAGRPALLLINRRGNNLYVTVRPRQQQQ